MDEEGTNLMLKDDFAREDHFQKVALEGARIGVIKAKRSQLPLLRPKGILKNARFCKKKLCAQKNFMLNFVKEKNLNFLKKN